MSWLDKKPLRKFYVSRKILYFILKSVKMNKNGLKKGVLVYYDDMVALLWFWIQKKKKKHDGIIYIKRGCLIV